MIDGLRGCRPRLAVDRGRADEPRVKRADARGADNDLACAFVFLVKPAGCTTTATTPPSSSFSSSSAPSRRRRSFPVIFRPTVHRRQGARVGNCASAEQRPRNKSSDEEKARPWRLRPSSEARQLRCSRRRGWGCTFKSGTEPTTTATLRRCRGKKGRQGGKRCQRRAATRCRAPGSRRADLHTCEPTRALQ